MHLLILPELLSFHRRRLTADIKVQGKVSVLLRSQRNVAEAKAILLQPDMRRVERLGYEGGRRKQDDLRQGSSRRSSSFCQRIVRGSHHSIVREVSPQVPSFFILIGICTWGSIWEWLFLLTPELQAAGHTESGGPPLPQIQTPKFHETRMISPIYTGPPPKF